MTGIEILNTTTIITHIHTWLWIILIIFGIFLVIIGFVIGSENVPPLGSGIVIVSILLCRSEVSSSTEYPKVQYQITIDETVSAQELLEKYNIIKIDGRIYTVELKNN